MSGLWICLFLTFREPWSKNPARRVCATTQQQHSAMVQLRSGFFSKPVSLRERIERVCIQFQDTFPLYGTPLDKQGHGNVHHEGKRSNTDDGATPGTKYDGRNNHKDNQAQQTIFPPERSEGPRVSDDTSATPVAENLGPHVSECEQNHGDVPSRSVIFKLRMSLMRLEEGNVQPFFQPRVVFQTELPIQRPRCAVRRQHSNHGPVGPQGIKKKNKVPLNLFRKLLGITLALDNLPKILPSFCSSKPYSQPRSQGCPTKTLLVASLEVRRKTSQYKKKSLKTTQQART